MSLAALTVGQPAPLGPASSPTRSAFPNDRESVPRAFQAIIAIYVLLTGELTTALQAALFGLVGGGELAFTAAFLSALAVDAARLAPLFLLSRHPMGILHPLIVVVVLWPLLREIPVVADQLGGLTGLFLGSPVHAPFYRGLGWQPAPDVWWATAYHQALELLALLSIYAGFVLTKSESAASAATSWHYDSARLRRLAVGLVALSVVLLAAFITYRGGIADHLADLSRGRFVALAGLGPLVAVVDIGTIALVLWVAARPNDVKSPLFLACLLAAAGAQFMSNGSRSAVLTLIIMVSLTWAFRMRRVPWRLAVMAVPAFLLTLGVLNIVRNAGWQGQSAGEALVQTDTAAVLSRIQTEGEARRSLEGAVPVIVDGFRVMDGPLLGQTYLAAIFAFVPRSIWEEKPRGPGSIYAQQFLGQAREGNSVPIGATAEAHWNFGIPGIIVIFFLYGLVIQKVSRMCLDDSSNPFVLAFFILFASTFQLTTEAMVLFVQQVTLLAVAYLAARIFITRSRVEHSDMMPRRVFPQRPDALQAHPRRHGY